MPTELVVLIVIVMAIIGIVVAKRMFVTFAENQEIDDMYLDVVAIIETDYRHRLNGNNRFIINPEVLQDMYPEKKRAIIIGVFKRLTDHKIVDRDPMDQAWCLR